MRFRPALGTRVGSANVKSRLAAGSLDTRVAKRKQKSAPAFALGASARQPSRMNGMPSRSAEGAKAGGPVRTRT
jgi:hypothetical protein